MFLKNTASIAPFESEVVMNQPYNGGNYCSDHLGVLTTFKDGVLNVDDESSVYPGEFKLFQNYPNPFNPMTTIKFSIPEAADIQMKVYDVLGSNIETLMNEYKPAGEYEVSFLANKLASGLYFYTMKAGEFTQSRKMILLK